MKRRIGEMHITVYHDEEDDDSLSVDHFTTFPPEVAEQKSEMTQPQLEYTLQLKNRACEAVAAFFKNVVDPSSDPDAVVVRYN